jgi:hypothetical protein
MPQVFILAAVLTPIACGCSTPPVSGNDTSATRSEAGLSDTQSRHLPDDGAWVRYHVNDTETTERVSGTFTLKVEGKLVEQETTVTRSEVVTLSYVGSVVEEGKPCRWLEVKTVARDENADKTWIRKMLVTEAGLMQNGGKRTGAQVMRAWLQKPDGSIIKEDENRSKPFVFLGTPRAFKNMQPSGKKQDFSLPSLRLDAAEAWHGKHQDSHSVAGLIKVRTDTEYTAWFHPDLPAGFVRLDWKSVQSFSAGDAAKTTKVVEYSVEDAGTGAQTELPDHN